MGKEEPQFQSADPLMKLEVVPKGVQIGNEVFTIKQNKLSCYGSYGGEQCGVLVPATFLAKDTREKVGATRRLVIAGADGGDNFIIRSSVGPTMIPSISFNCLGELLGRGSDGRMAMTKGRIVVLDFLPDERRELTPKQKRMTNTERRKLQSPTAGFVLVGQSWHRSATVLVKNAKTETRFLLGSDEGQYFGVELKGQPNTVDEAFLDLTPEAARVAGTKRQGEWYAVPVEEAEVPESVGVIEDMVLKKDDPESNNHNLSAYVIRIGNGVVFAKNWELQHSQHVTLTAKGWVKFLRNTAVRSVSEEGVD